jgi:hypothetical protein
MPVCAELECSHHLYLLAVTRPTRLHIFARQPSPDGCLRKIATPFKIPSADLDLDAPRPRARVLTGPRTLSTYYYLDALFYSNMLSISYRTVPLVPVITVYHTSLFRPRSLPSSSESLRG